MYRIVSNSETKEKSTNVISATTLSFIDHVVKKTQKTNKKELIEEVSKELVNHYGENSMLETRLAGCYLETTSDIDKAIDCYWISQELFPGKKFCKIRNYS